MDSSLARDPRMPAPPTSIGRVGGINGSPATVELNARPVGGENPTVGKFMALTTGKSVIIGLITEVGEQTIAAAAGASAYRKVARLDLIGEILKGEAGAARFQRGVTDYPNIGDGALMLSENELRLVYGRADADRPHIGNLQQNYKLH